MAVYPCPMIVEQTGGEMRAPRDQEMYRRTDLAGKWTGEWGYRITRVTNSVEFHPGTVMSKEHIQALINDDWTVTVLTGE